jgi:shikimate 5-dehydrogenase
MATVIFVGVSTAQSLIHRAFPLWAGHLGLDAEIAGVDLPVGTGRADYRRLVEDIRGDADCLGAVVTTHKVALFEAAADRFGTLDDLARSCREINAIRHCGEDLRGFARDPVSVGRVLDTIPRRSAVPGLRRNRDRARPAPAGPRASGGPAFRRSGPGRGRQAGRYPRRRPHRRPVR